MNVIIIDDHPWIIKSLCDKFVLERDISVYFLPESFFKKHTVDEFFFDSLTRPAWKKSGDGSINQTQIPTTMNQLDQPDKLTIFLINVDLKIGASTPRQDQNGVEILKHLRLTDELPALCNAPVILYSFRSIDQLLRHKPGNIILLSEGVTFFRLPEGLDILQNKNALRKFAGNSASVDDAFVPYIQGDFQLPDAFHPFSNWWGVHQLVKAANQGGYRQLQMPKKIKEEKQKLNNKKAIFLYGRGTVNSAVDSDVITRISCSEYRVLHLDDEPEWSEVLRGVIKQDSPSTHFKAVNNIHKNIIEGEENTENWVKEKLLSIDGIAPDLVLMDLRLYGKGDTRKPVEQTSGGIVARTIRKLSPGTPIILMTASNKAWVFEEMMKIGVDAYWMKEGIGEHLPPMGSVENFNKLKLLINTALGQEYQFLRRFTNSLRQIEDNPCWWKTALDWNIDPIKITPLEDEIKNAHIDQNKKDILLKKLTSRDVCQDKVLFRLPALLIILREYLYLFHMGYGYRGKATEEMKRIWLTSLFVEGGKLIELVHEFDIFEGVSSRLRADISLINARQDVFGRYLYRERNRMAHANSNTINFDNLRSFLSGLLAWLLVGPQLSNKEGLNYLRDHQLLFDKFAEINGDRYYNAV